MFVLAGGAGQLADVPQAWSPYLPLPYFLPRGRKIATHGDASLHAHAQTPWKPMQMAAQRPPHADAQRAKTSPSTDLNRGRMHFAR